VGKKKGINAVISYFFRLLLKKREKKVGVLSHYLSSKKEWNANPQIPHATAKGKKGKKKKSPLTHCTHTFMMRGKKKRPPPPLRAEKPVFRFFCQGGGGKKTPCAPPSDNHRKKKRAKGCINSPSLRVQEREEGGADLHRSQGG